MERLADLSAKDGTALACYRWTPAGTPRGDVVLVHGLAEHMGRYDHIARAFTDVGLRVTGYEARGHGHSGGLRAFVERWSDYTGDLDVVVDAVGGRPYVVAHSMGGLVTLDWLRERPDRVAGIVVSAPLLRATVQAPRWKVLAARVLSRLAPRLALANEIPAAHVSRDADVVAAYERDPLVFKVVTSRWYTEMLRAAERVVEHGPRYRTPALFMAGTGDRIVDPEAVAALAAAWGGPAEHRAWPGLYHEIFNDPERADVLAHATGWLVARLDGAASGA